MGSVARKSHNPAVPESVGEQIEELAAKMIEFDIKPEIEVFDLSMLYNAASLVSRAPLIFVQTLTGTPQHRQKLVRFSDCARKDDCVFSGPYVTLG
jgi:uncharacterized protein (DUF849 family)